MALLELMSRATRLIGLPICGRMHGDGGAIGLSELIGGIGVEILMLLVWLIALLIFWMKRRASANVLLTVRSTAAFTTKKSGETLLILCFDDDP